MSDSTVARFKHDGMEYSLDIADMTGEESGILKTHVQGYRGVNDFEVLFGAGDIQLMVVLVGLAMARSGTKNVNYKHLLSRPISEFEILGDDEENPTSTETPDETGLRSSQDDTE